MKRDDTEAGLIRRIAQLLARQEAAESDEVCALRDGENDAATGCRRRANQALYARRKLQKQLDDMRARVS